MPRGGLVFFYGGRDKAWLKGQVPSPSPTSPSPSPVPPRPPLQIPLSPPLPPVPVPSPPSPPFPITLYLLDVFTDKGLPHLLLLLQAGQAVRPMLEQVGDTAAVRLGVLSGTEAQDGLIEP